ncbi:MAG: DUF1254 domain-containing protein [Microcystis aeruginosa BK11-02]|nr:DUF1254 domain-containing protein [Microcystis aeruginosa BK11-02]NCS79111.1 DUF1254 domain-containing protein [Microcystis aeruginosa K13-07]
MNEYSWTWLDLTKDTLVLEVPPKVLGTVNDIWFRWVIDVGIRFFNGFGASIFSPVERVAKVAIPSQ